MDPQKKPTLILLPNVLDSELSHEDFFPPLVEKKVRLLQGIIAESEKGAHLFLRRFKPLHLPIGLLNEHSKPGDLKDLLEPLLKGECWGLISDCGMPCLADPGAQLVREAYKHKIEVEVVMGPTSLMIALLLSGLSAQKFSFQGYLPREEKELFQEIALLAKRASSEKTTYLCIEAPYRTEKLFSAFLKALPDHFLLCVASDLTMPTQSVETQKVAAWKKKPLSNPKRPTIFLFAAS